MEDPDANFSRVELWAERAASLGVRLLVLPEMFATGFSMAPARVAPHAERTREFLVALARRHGLWTLGGYAEPGASPAAGAGVDAGPTSRARNALSVYDPTGREVLHYQKVHPFSFAHEDEHYEGGTRLPSVTIEGARVTPVICYDLRFPELFRLAAADTDLFVVIANWPQARRHHWQTLLAARAIENQAYVLGVNRVGEGDGLVYMGDSALLSPIGDVLASASVDEALVVGTVRPADVAAVRTRMTFLTDRKPEVYRELLNPHR